MGLVSIQKKDDNKIRAFEELLAPVYNELYKFLYCLGRNKNLVDDAVQNTLVEAYTHISDLRDTSKFKPWIFTIGKRQVLNAVKAYSREVLIDFDENQSIAGASYNIPENWAINRETRSIVVETINSLKQEYRDIIILRYFANLSFEEIAELLNTNVNTVKTRHSRAKEKIYKELMSLKSKGQF